MPYTVEEVYLVQLETQAMLSIVVLPKIKHLSGFSSYRGILISYVNRTVHEMGNRILRQYG